MKPHIHIMTLGVSDMGTSVRFYRDGLGFKTTAKEDVPPIAFFDLVGTKLALYPRAALANDIQEGLVVTEPGFGGITLAHNVRKKDEVTKVLELAERAGARIVKPAQDAFWGGYHGYFADPDNYYWEVAYWKEWNFSTEGDLLLPKN